MKLPFPIVSRVTALLLLCTLTSCTKEARAGRKLDAAREHLKKSELQAAEIEYKNVLELAPGQPKAIKGLGIIWTRQGKLLEGARMLTTAKEALPTDGELSLYRARALFGMEFVPDSRAELEQLLERDPTNGEALMLYAETAALPEALDQVEERIARADAADDKWVQLAGALVELRRGMVESGTTTVDRILEKDPNFVRALALRGTIFRVRGKSEQALEPLKKAADLAGPLSEESVAYGSLLMELKRPEEATAWLKAATTKAPSHVPSWFALARIAAAEGNDVEAQKYLEKVLQLAPMDIPGTLLQAQIWGRGIQPAKAVDALDKLASAFPGRAGIELALAKASIEAKNFDKAAAALDSLIARIPAAPEPQVLRARVHLAQDQPADAARRLEQVLEHSPDHHEARSLLVSTYEILGRVDEAMALLTSAMNEAGDDSTTARFRLGQHLLTQGKTVEARADFEAVLAADPGNLQIIAHLIAVDLKEEKPADAMARVDAYIAEHPDSNDALRLKAELYHRAGDLKNAEAAALQALTIKPDDLLAYGIIVNVLIQDGKSDEAVAQLRKLITNDPDNSRARMHLALLLQQQGKSDEARAAYEDVLKLAPDSAAALNNLAYLESSNPKLLTSARDHAVRARQVAPQDLSIADTLGWIEWQLGDPTAALPLLTEAAAALPDLPSVHYHLGVVRYAMGQAAEAEASFETALASTKEFPEKEDAQKRIAQLRTGEDATMEDLQALIAANPNDVLTQLALARRHADAGQADAALASYQAALKANPSLAVAYIGIARLYAGPLDSPEKAMEAATQARNLAPRDPNALAVFGSAKLRAGAPQEAYGLLKDAMAQIPSDPALLTDYAQAAYLMGRVDEARETVAPVATSESPLAEDAKRFLLLTAPDAASQPEIATEVEKALTDNPSSIPALMIRGALEAAGGKNPEVTYQQILKQQPAFDPAKVRLAGVYLDDPDQLEQAVSLARETRTKLPTDQDLARILGIASYRHGDFSYAAQVLKELATQRPLVADELFALGMSQAATGSNDQASENLNSALEGDLSPTQATEAKAALGKMAEAKTPAPKGD